MRIHTAHVHKLLIAFLLLSCLSVSLIYSAPANGPKMGGRKKDFSTLIKTKSDFMILSSRLDSFSAFSTPSSQKPTGSAGNFLSLIPPLAIHQELCCCISYLSLEPGPSLQLPHTKLVFHPSPSQLAFPLAFLPNLFPSAARMALLKKLGLWVPTSA